MDLSTAKQRLWLRCLGYKVSDKLTRDEAAEMFEDAKEGQYNSETTDTQLHLLRSLGLQIFPGERCADTAGRLYEFLGLCAWAFSVQRFRINASHADRYSDLGIPFQTVVEIARQIVDTKMRVQILNFPTTDKDEVDVFYKIGKVAQRSKAFEFVMQRLSLKLQAPRQSSRPHSEAAAIWHSKPSPEVRHGCMVIVSTALTCSCGLLWVAHYYIFAI